MPAKKSDNIIQTETPEQSADFEEAVLDITGFATVGYDYEPGDFKYQFKLSSEEQAEFNILMQPKTWKEACQDDLRNMAFTCVLLQKVQNYFYMCLSRTKTLC